MTDPDPVHSHSERTLTVHCPWGLGNRVRLLLSGLAIARATGRRFRMFWPRTNDCAAGFADLFQNDWGVLGEPPDEQTQALTKTFAPWQRTPDLLDSQERHLVLRSNSWLIQPQVHSRHVQLMRDCAAIFHELVPIEPIQGAQSQFRQGNFRPSMIGVHVRRGDYVNPRVRPDTVFSLQRTLSAVDQYLEHSPQAGIFLCTDDGAVHPKTGKLTETHGIVASFQERYPERVVLAPSTSLDRGQTSAVQQALVELLLLRQTDYFVGTQQSSFSAMVMIGRDRPATLCSGPTPASERQERIARLTGAYHVAMMIGRRKLDPDAPFHYVWNLWLPGQIKVLPRRLFSRMTGQPF